MIYTFYSYKGGVGRSMALANVAECFYLQGLRVLIVDWDLEAPGLESFFFEPDPEDLIVPNSPPTIDKPPVLEGIAMVQSKLGLIDMLTEYKRSYTSILPLQHTPAATPIPEAFKKQLAMEAAEPSESRKDFAEVLDQHLPPLSTYLVPIHVPSTEQSLAGTPAASLRLLPAGWRYKERFQAYGQAVQAFDWDGFYASYRGKEYFDWLRQRLLRTADVVLIDSRTGVTEMGGVCARQLADVVVSFAAPNNQNIDGVARMTRSFKRPETIAARDNRQLDTIIVPTRIDPSELNLLREFQQRFERKVDESANSPVQFRDLNCTFWDLGIPYRTFYSYWERRVIGPDVSSADPTKGLENAYWKLASHLALLAPETHAIRQRFAARLQAEFPTLLPKVVLSYLADAAPDAAQARAFLRNTGITLWPDLRHESESDDLQSSANVLTQTKHVVVVLSERAQADAGIIRRELRFARQQGKTAHLLLLSGPRPTRPWLLGLEIYTSLTDEFVQRLRTIPREIRAPLLVPSPRPGYVERLAAQHEIKTALLETGASTGKRVLAVWGPGGSGKTSLLTRVCQDEDVIDAYSGGIFFVKWSEPAAAAAMVEALSPGTIVSDSPQAFRTAATLLHGRRCLIVLDDVWSEKEIGGVVSLGEASTVVLLTRDLSLANSVAAKVVRLEQLTADEAETLLPGASQLADRLGRLPLALSLVRSALQQEASSRRTDADAIATVAERLDRHGILAFDRPGTERQDSIARSVEFTLSRLQGWERKRFEQLAGLSSAGHTTLAQIQDQWLALPPGTGEPRPLTNQLLEALCRRLSEWGVITWEPGTGTISLHALIRDYFVAQGILRQTKPGTGPRHASSGRDRRTNRDVELARRALGGAAVPFEDLTALAKRLKSAGYFSYARQLWARVRHSSEASARARHWGQQHSLCTYKDPDLPSAERAERALEILNEVDDLTNTKDQESLGLAGAVFKYKWGVDGQRLNLERSLAYYLRGYQKGVQGDFGYTGINAAFVLDLIAFQEESESTQAGLNAATTAERRNTARKIREDIVEQVPPCAKRPGNEYLEKQWWFLVTIAEACFGLQRHEEARYWLREALAIEVDDWEFESTARQFARLALVQNDGEMPSEDSPAYQTLRIFLGSDVVALRSVAVGKVGLALSGGGFRASLFHLGVLAKLAELDVLRHVEVLSCVSGGSIIGAHYYLEVKRLLESQSDAEITRDHYVAIVKRMETDFLAGVQTNLRTRLLANPWINLKTFALPHYTRTDRLGDLIETNLYSKVTGQRLHLLNELLVQPKNTGCNFAPKSDNWRRAAKVPILILNATTLNTGHNWQFTASWMGEPPAGLGKEVDGNDLLRRMYYWEAPKNHQSLRLGRAVAASACVPGLFDPVEFQRLYPKRTVRLVDGGVNDNQGIGGLLEQECGVLLVSDASGQMSSQNFPGADPFRVPLRASAILGARVRETQYLDLEARRRSGQLKSLMFVHLKKDLESDPVDWVNCLDPYEATDDARPVERRGPLTRYGIRKSVQAHLAAVRTDLDSFSDVEAFALMLSGYRMAEHEFGASVKGIPTSPEQAEDWRFLAIEPAMACAKDYEEAHDDLLKILKASGSRAFKIWRLSRGLQFLGGLVLLFIGWLAVQAGPPNRAALPLAALIAFVPIVGVLSVSMLIWTGFRLQGVRKPLGQLVTGLFFGTVGWLVPRLHLSLFDPGFLSWGRVRARQFSGVPTTAAWWRPLFTTGILGLTLFFVYRYYPVLTSWLW